MRRKISLIFQIAAVFIGTVVGAGLASGQEIKQFFTVHGYRGFLGILVCGFLYMYLGSIIVSISTKYKLNSYDNFIKLVSPGIFGHVIDIIMSLFLVSGSAIILAASGALLHQYFGFSKWVGIILMIIVSLFTLLRDTKGLLEINSFIVPSLIIILVVIFAMFCGLDDASISISRLKAVPATSNINWVVACFLYAGFNIFSCSGVLVPLSKEANDRRSMILGVCLGAIGLTLLAGIINFMLLLNVPYISEYEIPLLYIVDRFGIVVQIFLLCIMWLEMFSTEVSDIYSLGKTMEEVFHIPYKKAIFIVLAIAIPISQIGFVKLITYLYPAFGVISFVFLIQCLIFYYKHSN